MASWARTQTCVSASSGEAEYVAMPMGSAEGLYVQSFLSELGETAAAHMWSDSSAARAIAQRVGCGKLKHM